MFGTALEVFPDMAGELRPIADKLSDGRLVAIGGLCAGTDSGKPSVAFVIETEDGRYVLGQTTLRLLLTALDAIKAVQGDPR
jgi:hypothetical protein